MVDAKGAVGWGSGCEENQCEERMKIVERFW